MKKRKETASEQALEALLLRNWKAITVRSILVILAMGFFLLLFLALVPIIQKFYVDGITPFGNQQENPNEVQINYKFGPPTSESDVFSDYAYVPGEIRNINSPEEYTYAIDNFCFDSLSRMDTIVSESAGSMRSESHRSGSSSRRGDFDTPSEQPSEFGWGGFLLSECINQDTTPNNRIPYEEDRKTRKHKIGSFSSYYFPFDTVLVDTTFLLLGKTVLEGDVDASLVPQIHGDVVAPNWDVVIETTRFDTGENVGYNVKIKYERPLIYRLVIPLLFVLVLAVIFAIPFISKMPILLETIIGVLFGLWGIHDVLIPPDITWPTIIDPLILFLYALLAFSAIIRVIIIPTWKKVGE